MVWWHLLLLAVLAQQRAIADEAAVDPARNAGGTEEEPVILLNMHGDQVREGWTLVRPAQPAEEGGEGAPAPVADLVAPRL